MVRTKTHIFLEEIKTDGHSPMKFLCLDGEIYFCKYRVSPKLEELDCLVYEVIGQLSQLLRYSNARNSYCGVST